jgi:hypothetical protein
MENVRSEGNPRPLGRREHLGERVVDDDVRVEIEQGPAAPGGPLSSSQRNSDGFNAVASSSTEYAAAICDHSRVSRPRSVGSATVPTPPVVRSGASPSMIKVTKRAPGWYAR